MSMIVEGRFNENENYIEYLLDDSVFSKISKESVIYRIRIRGYVETDEYYNADYTYDDCEGDDCNKYEFYVYLKTKSKSEIKKVGDKCFKILEDNNFEYKNCLYDKVTDYLKEYIKRRIK